MKKNIKTRLEINKKVISTLQQKQVLGGALQPETNAASNCKISCKRNCRPTAAQWGCGQN